MIYFPHMTDTRKLDIQAQFNLLPENARQGFADYRVLEVLPGGTMLLEHKNESRRVVAAIYPPTGAPDGHELLASFNKLFGSSHRVNSSREDGAIKTFMVSYQPPEAIIPTDFTSWKAIPEIVRLTVSMLTGQVSPVYTITTSDNILGNLKRMKSSTIVAQTDDIAAAMEIFEEMFAVLAAGDMRQIKNVAALDAIMDRATNELGIPVHFGHEYKGEGKNINRRTDTES